ncbi:TadE/TadG family type IV pilus assembly protein [Sphingosinicella rhizophila]|uniref:TadE/TadG family type IV pilus assembly protein n=1 Tax=Sphingosinicella rhizophila TaxID=3050082 RepID=A0ABU3Q7J2_9SPHN|nr:TadE/TadG family type IV pilus assembly protein [Sphingosinicella sp. GR2756]MDT9599267.1 TadE/TadG family type IV pilus assembly protein [Sphingosinicella sp. GR2756]
MMMRTIPSRLRRLTGALRRSESGLAMTEFALSLPILLTLGLVGMEVSGLMMAHLRVSNIAMMTADNASRVRDAIDEGDVYQLFMGATQAGASIDFAQHGRIILYSVEPTPSGGFQWIRWQRCTGSKAVAPTYGRPRTSGGTAITNGTEETTPSSPTAFTTNPHQMTAIGPAGNQIAAQSGTAVMFAEVFYDYQPIMAKDYLGAHTIHYVSAFNVRQRTNQVLTNLGNITRATCA